MVAPNGNLDGKIAFVTGPAAASAAQPPFGHALVVDGGQTV